jgi:hypothetical protein
MRSLPQLMAVAVTGMRRDVIAVSFIVDVVFGYYRQNISGHIAE